MKTTLSWMLAFSLASATPSALANPALAAARAAEALRSQQAAARIASEQNAARAASVAAQANRTRYAQQTAAAQSRAAFEQQARSQAAFRHTEFLRVNAQQAQANKQRLAIQSHIKQQVDIAKRNLPARPVARMTTFNNNANAGLIYQRRTGASDVYIGQTKNLQRFPVRQTEHAKKLNTTSSYQLVGGAPGGDRTLLRVAEQAAYDAQNKYSAKMALNVTNAIRPMAEVKYMTATAR